MTSHSLEDYHSSDIIERQGTNPNNNVIFKYVVNYKAKTFTIIFPQINCNKLSDVDNKLKNTLVLDDEPTASFLFSFARATFATWAKDLYEKVLKRYEQLLAR